MVQLSRSHRQSLPCKSEASEFRETSEDIRLAREEFEQAPPRQATWMLKDYMEMMTWTWKINMGAFNLHLYDEQE